MARARNIKPKFFQNEELAEVPPLGRLLFIGLWTICDFRGCLEYRPKRIRAQLLPYDDCNTDELLTTLEKSGFIQTYTVRGQRYIKIVTFEKHQTPHKNERDAGSEHPDITDKDSKINGLQEIQNNPDKNGTAQASSLFLNPDSPILNPDPGSPKSGNNLVALTDDRAVPEPKPEKKGAIIARVFAFWQDVMSSPKSALDAARKTLIENALKNYSPEDLCEAIRGCAMTEHNMGMNDRNQKYNGLNIILKNADNIDRFINKARTNPNGKPVGQVQTDAEYLADVQAALNKLNGHTRPDGDDDNIIDMED